MSPKNPLASRLPSRSHGATLVLGAPGTGKTSSLIECAFDHVGGGEAEGASAEEILLLAPTRTLADQLRDGFSQKLSATISTPPARAWHSYAFDILRRAHAEGLLEGVDFEPRLLTGPEQDVLIGEMLLAHSNGLGKQPQWPEELKEALETRGFRREIREFLDRCAEFDLSPERVRELGNALNHPEWVAASDFRVEYEQLRRLRMPQAYDPSALIHQAANFLESNPEFLAKEHERLRLILVDDLQEATPAIMRLLESMAPAAAVNPPQLVMTACTDTVVQGFRGARPEVLAELGSRLKAYPEIETRRLDRQHRLPSPIADSVRRVSERIPVVARARHDRSPEPSDAVLERSTRAEIAIRLTASAQHELRLISQGILEEHVKGGRPLGDMAVVVRDGTSLARIKRHLESDGIPVSIPVAETPLREEPAVRPFLDALWLASGEHGPADISRALSLLTSRLGGASPNTVRRIRQSLRAAELRRGGTRSSDELILEVLNGSVGPSALTAAPHRNSSDASGTRTNEPLERLHSVLSAGKRAMEENTSTAETVLWALWETSGLAQEWLSTSKGTGPAAQRAHRDLDAMLALFETAERYVDQQPGAGAREFLEYIDSQDLPMDTLAPRSTNHAAVALVTPASAAGREWAWVHVASVQQGSWPNTTLRGGLLSTPELSDVVLLGVEQAVRVTRRNRLRETRYDELRMFATAISRCTSQLVVSAVANEEEEASEFLDILDPVAMSEAVVSPVRRPMTMRGLIAELRLWAQSADHPGLAFRAAEQLARLAQEPQSSDSRGNGSRRGEEMVGIPGAHPRDWWGLAPLTDESAPLNVNDPVPVSPSKLETIRRSPLDWFVSSAGGEPATDLSRSVGNLIHEIAQNMPDAPGHELEEELERRFGALGLSDTWETRVVYDRAVTMIRKFAAYAVDSRASLGRKLVGVEGAFEVLVPGPARDALLSGRVDRLEIDELGRYVVIDLKTGKSAPSAADVTQHPQLAAYQVALEAGAGAVMFDHGEPASVRETPLRFDGASITELSGGAALVQLGTSTKAYKVQSQEPLTEQDYWAVDLIRKCAELVAHERFQARHTDSAGGFGLKCRLPEICPLCSSGRQVTQP
ncbi:ATP-dependent DNA helicase [Kocuria sp. TGY1127_2]|uniref:ATP-dependent helicase n=1 Tax=Kocuria sp. TGY1127_2 TaxID=2711328 RepID=UPI0015BEEDDA|nr:ATP-dependent DNA helicase [Kocuria sp. TGY1127_2]